MIGSDALASKAVFDLTAESRAGGLDRARRNQLYFYVGMAAFLVGQSVIYAAIAAPVAAAQGLDSGAGVVLIVMVGTGAFFVVFFAALSGGLRAGAVSLVLDSTGVELQYPSGRREFRSWRDPRACIDLVEYRIRRTSRRHDLPVGSRHHAVQPPHPWSPASYLDEVAYSAVETEAKQQGLFFVRQPLYGGWGDSRTAIIRLTIRRPKPEPRISTSSVRYLIRARR